ncbi:MAG: protein kinase [Corynebacterium sp.]|nr:protein kinase [Corynebacterium sp.]
MDGTYLDGRYRLDRLIAKGGMSTVYKAYDMKLRREVAAKVLDDAYSERFLREAHAMAALSHPNLIAIYDIGDNYLILELSDGGTLRELLRERGPMPPQAAIQVIKSVLQGLKVIHNAGMVHRDIKPENILINQNHEIKLADFGLVQRGGDRTSENVLGTVDYMSPEQVQGRRLGPASDIYSVGIVLFELLTGQVPFQANETIAKAQLRLTHSVPPPSAWIEGIPPIVDEFVLRATTHYYPDASAFLADLEHIDLPRFEVPAPTRAAAYRATTTMMPTAAPAEKVLSNRALWRLWIYLVAVFIAMLCLGTGAWWLGSGHYGLLPEFFINLFG